jgi:hypothetical protein
VRAGTSGRGEVMGKGGRRVNMVQKKSVHIYVNAKRYLLKLLQESG